MRDVFDVDRNICSLEKGDEIFSNGEIMGINDDVLNIKLKHNSRDWKVSINEPHQYLLYYLKSIGIKTICSRNCLEICTNENLSFYNLNIDTDNLWISQPQDPNCNPIISDFKIVQSQGCIDLRCGKNVVLKNCYIKCKGFTYDLYVSNYLPRLINSKIETKFPMICFNYSDNLQNNDLSIYHDTKILKRFLENLGFFQKGISKIKQIQLSNGIYSCLNEAYQKEGDDWILIN